MDMSTRLPEPLIEGSRHKWEAFTAAARKSTDIDYNDQAFVQTLQRMFVFSDYTARCAKVSPDIIADLYNSGDLERPYPSSAYMDKLAKQVQTVTSEEAFMRVLRRSRHRELIRIAWRDIGGQADLSETLTDLTRFAEASIEHSLVYCHRELTDQFGIPIGKNGAPQQMVVIGMGKLGGAELNFSSDIDLIFAYPQSGDTQGGPRSISNEEFFLKLGRRLLSVLGKKTTEGFVHRVDLRLRPYGENGPLVMHFDALEQYYQQQGREWERYAWIKARAVAGDIQAGKALLKRLNPFVYRRYLDYGAFESLRDMKDKITMEVQRKGYENNIKLGAGGIREIEFFGQIFQLIRGGVTPTLQVRSIQQVLRQLSDEGIVPASVCTALNHAYVFLRTVENRLQAFADQQVHQIPTDPLDKTRLALSMGYAQEALFYQDLERHREAVHQQFSMLLATRDDASADDAARKRLEGIWQGILDHDSSESILAEFGYNAPADAYRLLTAFREDLNSRHLSKEYSTRLDRLMPLLIQAIALSDSPQTTLQRIIDLVKAIGGRAAYLALLLENPESLSHLVSLTCASSLIASFLSRHPVLLDELLDPRTLYAPPKRDETEAELQLRLDRLSDDFEHQMEEMRVFKQINTLRVAAADITEALPLMHVSDHLSDIAEISINAALELAWGHLVAKHGRPMAWLNEQECPKGFVVIAYGKLGGLELGYSSDLDLVFLHAGTDQATDGRQHPIDSNQFYARLGQRVIHMMTTPTRAGILYETDMRLRPSGSSGILVSHIESFRDYQLKDAWTWEHQALLRARPVGGDPALQLRFSEIRQEVLSRRQDRDKLRHEVLSMRQKMRRELLKPQPDVFDLKQDTGGIVDIEFLVQYLVLRKSHQHPQLLQWTDNVRLIQTLLETGVIDEISAHQLKHAYLIYRAVAHKLSLQEKPAQISAAKFPILRQRVVEIWEAYFKPGL